MQPIVPFFAFLLSTAVLSFAPARAQETTSTPQPVVDPAEVARVRATLEFLASDDLAGRDTPSPGLERAVEYATARMQKAGLVPVKGHEFVQRYEMAGWRISNRAIECTLQLEDGTELRLEGERDLRIVRLGDAVSSRKEPVFLRSWVDPERNSPASDAKQPWIKLLELDGDAAFWKSLSGDREQLANRRRQAKLQGTPMIAVRAGVLPKGPFTASIKMPVAAEVKLALPNVIGLIPGSERPDEIVLISAHIDHVGTNLPRSGDDPIFNGADDDATGSTAVLHLAERFAARAEKPKRTLAFALFSGEEKGLVGSAALAENPPFKLENIVVNLNLEMLGRPEPGKRFYAWFTGTSLSDFAERAKPAFLAAGVDVIEFKMGEQLFFASDNTSFARKGVVAHSISAGSLHDDYHQPSDEASRIDVEHMTAAIGGIEKAIDLFASGTDRLSYTEAAKKRLQGGR